MSGYMPVGLSGGMVETSEKVKAAALNYAKVAAVGVGIVAAVYLAFKTRDAYRGTKAAYGRAKSKLSEMAKYRLRLVKE